MKDKIKSILENALPLIDFDSEFLFEELDSLGVTSILMLLSEEFDITLDASDATPKNMRSVESLAAMVQKKLNR